MRRISVDFNTLTSAPVDVVNFHAVSPVTGESYEDLAVGDQAELYEDEETTAFEARRTATYGPPASEHNGTARP
jgi:hypothetical protein